jgi:Rad3-related DNA helicase
MTGRNHEGAEPTRRLLAQAVALVDEAHALSYALIRVLASSPREELSRDDIDALCQLAYELLNKLAQAQELFQQIDRGSDT